jgi:hypothetical protein
MKKTLWILVGWLACDAFAANASGWRPSDALLRAVRHVESSNGRNLYGDGGRSLGHFQLSEAAWIDVSAWRKERGLKVYSYRSNVMHPYINQAYAADYLTMIHGELSRKYRRSPTVGEIYAAYNMGLSNFAECRYRLANVNPVTARKAREIHSLIEKSG